MKTIAYTALACAAVLSLAACGKSDKASEEATAENVEMPAEEAMSGVDATAAPASDAAAPEATAPGAARLPCRAFPCKRAIACG
jgi:predicted small lipoprotein YifL